MNLFYRPLQASLRLLGVHEFFHFIFPCTNIFFVLRLPPAPHKFSQRNEIKYYAEFRMVFFRNKTGRWKLGRRGKSGDILQWLLGNCL